MYTLITGASDGIGKALAEECATRKMNLLLVALPDKSLKHIGLKLQHTYGIRCETLGVDLSTAKGCKAVHTWIEENNYDVNILINNVGVGSKGAFEEPLVEFYHTQINLNTATACMLTHMLLPVLKKNTPARIMNVGSLGGFYFLPGKAVYSATKAFVYSFSRSLRLELESSNILVSVLCPGGTDSNEKTIAINKDLKGFARWSILTSEEVAKQAIPEMLKGKAVIIPGFFNKCYYALSLLTPEFIVNFFIAREFKNVKGHKYHSCMGQGSSVQEEKENGQLIIEHASQELVLQNLEDSKKL